MRCSINRNIVECKDKINGKMYIGITVLIETLWNVKSGTPVSAMTPQGY